MKTNFFLQLFAAIVRNFFPRLAVKFFIKKTNPDACMFLPGANKELDLIVRLRFDSKQLQERHWSLDTKVSLLAQGEDALLSEIRTEKEFISVVQNGNIVMLKHALRYYTPSKEKVCWLIDKLGQDTVKIIESIPSVFDSLESWEFLGVDKNKTYPLDGERWVWAMSLVKAKSAWAPKFMRELKKFPPQLLGKNGEYLFEMFFKRALDALEDVSDMMAYLYVIFPKLYIQIRKNIYGYNSVYPYFHTMYEQLRRYMDGYVLNVPDMEAICDDVPERQADCKDEADRQEAYIWLKIGFRRCYEAGIRYIFIKDMPELKNLLDASLYQQLFSVVAEFAVGGGELSSLLKMADESFKKKLQKKLVSSDDAARSVLDFFPFDGWEEKTAQKAILALVEKNMLPTEKIASLSEPLQKFAFRQMEIKAQILALKKNMEKLLSCSCLLYPEAEQYLFDQSEHSYVEKLACGYIEEHQMADSSFLYILNNRADLERLLFVHADKWGLSKKQYLAVLQSKYAHLAPYLKKYVHKAA